MSSKKYSETLDLLGALQTWCDQPLVGAVRHAEMLHSVAALALRKEPSLSDWMERPWSSWNSFVEADRNPQGLTLGWNALERDFRRRIEREEFFLQGIEATADLAGHPQRIRGSFVSRFKFDFKMNTIACMGRLFVSIRVSQAQFPETPNVQPAPPSAKTLRAEDIPGLDDATVLALLEVHAERVLASNDPHLIHPSKVSLMPIIRKKMEYRHAQGEMRATLTAEAKALEVWIQLALPSYQTPKWGSIKNKMSDRYEQLRASSNRIIDRTEDSECGQ